MLKPKVRFYGAFLKKKAADSRAKEVGGEVKVITLRGVTRFAVVTEK